MKSVKMFKPNIPTGFLRVLDPSVKHYLVYLHIVHDGSAQFDEPIKLDLLTERAFLASARVCVCVALSPLLGFPSTPKSTIAL